MEIISGYIEHIVYRNDDNGYTVLNLVTEGEDLTCVGFFRYADEGENVELKGDFIEHPVYGQQFSVQSYEVKEPTDKLSIIRYLGSGAIKGIGQALATRIVNKFGDETFRIIEEEPERLSSIKGISEKKAREIALQVIEKQDLRKIMVFLQQYGISNALAMKIYKRYGQEAYDVINENPYKLADDISGVGFKIADEIATRVGIHTDSDYRIRSGIMHVLTNAAYDGHCYLPKDELISQAVSLLDVLEESVWIQTMNLSMDKRLFIKQQEEETVVYGKNFYYAEINCARMLNELNVLTEDDELAVRRKIELIEKSEDIELEELQRDAVVKAVMNGITIITGGPGTGKTTIINMIIKFFEIEQMDICLAAPTGRAAKRMTEATGYEASTIQRLLHLNVSDNADSGYFYEMNEDNPIETDVVIIDEMSMVDIVLFKALLNAIPVGTRLILVGDTNQLPSVGPGAVLKDIIASGCIDTVKLKKIFRQSEMSDIIVNAHKINEGCHLTLNNKSKDFFLLKRDSVDLILNNMIVLIKEKLPKYVKAQPYDIQVLTPMRKGNLGVESLNPILQKYLNPPDKRKTEKDFGNVIFREGDKVMQIKNDYQLEWEITSKYGIPIDKGMGIFNGDMGIIREIDDFSEYMVVEYDGMRKVRYPFSMVDELELAYAVTIHKSQGTEYPAVIIPLLTGPKMLFNRNLLYTGVTRAKDCVVILGSEEQVNRMIDNADENKRYTGLDLRLAEIANL